MHPRQAYYASARRADRGARSPEHVRRPADPGDRAARTPAAGAGRPRRVGGPVRGSGGQALLPRRDPDVRGDPAGARVDHRRLRAIRVRVVRDDPSGDGQVRCFRCNPAPDHSPRRDVRSAISTTDIVRTPFPIRVALRRQLPPSFAFEEQGDQGAHDERPEEGAEAQDRHVRERDREREQRP
jgi:hypothetical protein